MEVVERNKDSPFPSLATMWIFNICEKKSETEYRHTYTHTHTDTHIYIFIYIDDMYYSKIKQKQMVLPRKHSKVLKKICTTDGTE